MKKLRKFLSRIRLVYRRSSTLLKCIVLATIVLSTVTVITLNAARIKAQKREEAARAKAAALQQENQQIRDDIAILGTVDSIKKIASELLGLVDPDTIYFDTGKD